MPRTSESWDRYWQGWCRNHPDELWQQDPDAELVTHANGPGPAWFKGKRVLDWGCGIGRMAREVASHCASYTGVDISRWAIQKASTLCPFNTRFMVIGDAELPQVDSIICRDVAIHLTDDHVRFAAGQWKKCLAPGGGVWASFYFPHEHTNPAVHPSERNLKPGLVVLYDTEDLREMFAGFDVRMGNRSDDARIIVELRHK